MVDQQQVSIIDEINRQISEFKINKDKKDDDVVSNEYIFVNKEENRFWLSLFLKNFLSLSATSQKSSDEDDLIFFVRKKPTKFFQQYENKLEVFRRTQRNCQLEI